MLDLRTMHANEAEATETTFFTIMVYCMKGKTSSEEVTPCLSQKAPNRYKDSRRDSASIFILHLRRPARNFRQDSVGSSELLLS